MKETTEKFRFVWDDFTEEAWSDYCSRAENDMLAADDVIATARLGDLCLEVVVGAPEVVIGEPRDESRLFIDLFVGGVDDGYGYSALEALMSGKYKNKHEVPAEEQYPYTHVATTEDCFDDGCVWMTFEDFKKAAEDKMTSVIKEAEKTCDYGIMEKAMQPLHVW